MNRIRNERKSTKRRYKAGGRAITRALHTVILAVFLLLLSSVATSETIMADCSSNQREYGIRVAALTAVSPSLGFRKGQTESVIVMLRTDGTKIGLEDTGADICIAGPGNRFTLKFSGESIAAAALERLSANPHVVYAERDAKVFACDTTVSDEVSFLSYGADKMAFQPLLSMARKENGSVTVAVIDSGIGQHPDLSSRTSAGWDYVDNDDDPSNDGYGHGTHVAGIIADCTRGTGVFFYSLRVLDDNGGGTLSNVMNAVLDAAENHIPLINLSIAAQGVSAAVDDAVLTAVRSGCTVVAAAGNDGRDTSGYSPAHLMTEGVIVVGAADANGGKAGYSNDGTSVDCFAYGTGIRSCRPGGGYTEMTGTSQAAPHITAACALLKLIYGESGARLEARIKALTEMTEGFVPAVDGFVPGMIPCHLTRLTVGVGQEVRLPTEALPLQAREPVNWRSSDDAVFTVDEEGRLIGRSAGEAALIRNCRNFEEISVPVTVIEKPAGVLNLPLMLTEIQGEAFANTGAYYVAAPDTLTRIDRDSFDGQMVILCELSGALAEIAEDEGLPYIAY